MRCAAGGTGNLLAVLRSNKSGNHRSLAWAFEAWASYGATGTTNTLYLTPDLDDNLPMTKVGYQR